MDVFFARKHYRLNVDMLLKGRGGVFSFATIMNHMVEHASQAFPVEYLKASRAVYYFTRFSDFFRCYMFYYHCIILNSINGDQR